MTQANWAGNNWGQPQASNSMTNYGGVFNDGYGIDDENARPSAIHHPDDDHGGDLVQTVLQEYRAGSLESGKGLLIKSHLVKFHRGFARQETP